MALTNWGVTDDSKPLEFRGIRIVGKITIPEPMPKPVHMCNYCGETYNNYWDAINCSCVFIHFDDCLD